MAHSPNQLHWEGNGQRSVIRWNGVDITNQCRINETGGVDFPDWVSKEINDAFKEMERAKKPVNRVLRFLRLYRPKYAPTRTIRINKPTHQTLP